MVMSNDNLLAQVSAAISKDELAIINASDDRELMAAGKGDGLPYEFEYDVLVNVHEVKAKKEYDSRGVFVKLDVIKVFACEKPTELKEGEYTLAFFDVHPKIPPFVIADMLRSRREFAAAIAQTANTAEFKASDVIAMLHKEVQPLGIRLRIRNTFTRQTRTSKRLHRLSYELVK
jgi:hypothetical protein